MSRCQLNSGCVLDSGHHAGCQYIKPPTPTEILERRVARLERAVRYLLAKSNQTHGVYKTLDDFNDHTRR